MHSFELDFLLLELPYVIGFGCLRFILEEMIIFFPIEIAEVLGCLERRKAVQLAVDREEIHCVVAEREGFIAWLLR
jgi:hypothetical protein